jgi:hypothetical protein
MRTFLLLFIFCHALSAKDKLISFGDVDVGEGRIRINLKDFKVFKKGKNLKVKARLIPGSVQWIRGDGNLLLPRARLKILLPLKSNKVFFKYLGETLIPEKTKKGSSLDVYVNLFNPGDIHVFNGKKDLGTLSVQSKQSSGRKRKKKLIDYSCSRYQLEFKGLEDDYMSIGCRLERIGKWKTGRPRLVVTWATTNWRLLDNTSPPYKVILKNHRPAVITLQNLKGKKRTITIKAKLPKRLHRLKTALGLGPYMFKTSKGVESRPQQVAPAFMLYGKFDFLKTSSLRFFDALMTRDSLFNNAGLYFAYELAGIKDGRIEIIPLLGAQILTYRFEKNQEGETKIIYPQGAEVVWNNAWGIENYSVVFGTFLSTSSREGYVNTWVRWGKGYFWELNYINYDSGGDKASMYGLSIGFPLISFF